MPAYRDPFSGKFISSAASIAQGQVTRLQGVEDVLRRFKHLETATAAKAERGIIKAALQLLRFSKQIVPVDTGDLKASGKVEVRGKGFQTKAFVVYTTNYAIFVHEDLNARHKKGKSAKYIEIPMRRHHRLLMKIVADELRKRR